MPSIKLRTTTPLPTDQILDQDEPKLQDEGFQALPRGHIVPQPVHSLDVGLGDNDNDNDQVNDQANDQVNDQVNDSHSNSENNDNFNGDGDGVSVHSDPDNHNTSGQDNQDISVDAAHTALEPLYAPAANDALMANTFSSGDSTSWFPHLNGLEPPHGPGLPFGYHANDSSDTGADSHDHEMSDDDGGGVSLVNLSMGETDHYMNDFAPTPQSPHHDATLTPQQGPLENPSAPGIEPGEFLAGHSGNATVVDPGLPFGFVQGVIEIQPPDHWDDPVPSSPELPPAPPVVPEHLVPPTSPIEEDHQQLTPSSTNLMVLGSNNVDLVPFLHMWALSGSVGGMRMQPPDIRSIDAQAKADIKQVAYQDLRGDRCDFQGLDWTDMGTTRATARARRHISYRNYVNRDGSDLWTYDRPDIWIPSSESYFRFRRMTIRDDVGLAHFQLRSVLACPSRSQVYYPCWRGVNKFNPISKKTELALCLAKFPEIGRRITTLDANSDVLVGGTFKGDFVVKSLYSEDEKFSKGLITGMAGITNHLQVHAQRRSSSPVAAISSNDRGFRILDIQTEQFTADFLYHFALNCSAVSPDRRLRVLVGDIKDVTITNAETGETEVELTGHRDYGFACDWSEDGRTVATGFQDKSIKIWDARKWTDTRGRGTPIASIWCDLASARSLKFSPLGNGPPVLVAAEEADYVNIIDARTFQKKQTIDLFGEIGGVAFTDEGRELNVLVSDIHRGGLLQFDRCGLSRGGKLPSMMEHMPPF